MRKKVDLFGRNDLQCTRLSFPRAPFRSLWRRREGGNPLFLRNLVMESKTYFVYILANERNGTLYVGVTNDLIRRVFEHKNNIVKGFTEKYKVHNLVYYEFCNNIEIALNREKNIKKWYRQWKINLINTVNPEWNDLYKDLI